MRQVWSLFCSLNDVINFGVTGYLQIMTELCSSIRVHFLYTATKHSYILLLIRGAMVPVTVSQNQSNAYSKYKPLLYTRDLCTAHVKVRAHVTNQASKKVKQNCIHVVCPSQIAQMNSVVYSANISDLRWVLRHDRHSGKKGPQKHLNLIMRQTFVLVVYLVSFRYISFYYIFAFFSIYSFIHHQ